MELKSQTILELKAIVEKDYGVLLSDDEANQMANALLRLTRLSLATIARLEERKTESWTSSNLKPYSENKASNN